MWLAGPNSSLTLNVPISEESCRFSIIVLLLRDMSVIESGQEVEQQTRHWDEAEGRTHKLRSKEEAFDYRYFPEPDLVPVEPSEEWVKEIANSLPPLPRDRRHLLADSIGVEPTETSLIVQRNLDTFALQAISSNAD